MKHWQILAKLKVPSLKFKIDEIIDILLKNRGLTNEKVIKEFLDPSNPDTLDPKPLGINSVELVKAVKRIKKAIESKEQVVVYGDFDADGICGTAILWETLNKLGAKVMPYIPHRIDEGYGLSQKGIDNLSKDKPSLIITTDHGITAKATVTYAKKQGIEVIITDHHQKPKVLPDSYALVWTDKLSGAGVAWILARELTKNSKININDYLDLAALATIADLSPLVGFNRSIVRHGLEELNKTQRAGLLALIKDSGLSLSKIGVYEVGHILAPRLNATGRLTHALDSLRLLCTQSPQAAQDLAQKLGATNRDRQQLTEETILRAREVVLKNGKQVPPLIFIADKNYNQGIIGLVAGKLAEEFYRPAIVVSYGETYSKASARSISGFNIVETIRLCSDILVDVGGHPMAAGFTVETRHLETLKSRLEEIAQKELDEETLKRILKIDCELDLEDLTWELYDKISKLAPFGIGNPEPIFTTSQAEVKSLRLVGNDGKHLKLVISHQSSAISFDAIGFGFGEWAGKIKPGDKIDLAYTLAADTWNGNEKLQLKIRDLRLSG